jgi:hypothetical protein
VLRSLVSLLLYSLLIAKAWVREQQMQMLWILLIACENLLPCLCDDISACSELLRCVAADATIWCHERHHISDWGENQVAGWHQHAQHSCTCYLCG